MGSFLRQSASALFFLVLSMSVANFAYADPDGISVTSANVFGVTTSNQLIRFNSSSPSNISTIGTITGLQGGETILGIDFRPATGELFALGSSGRLYVVNRTTAEATSPRLLSVALSGTTFGVDFNPTVDRLRIVSDTGQNLRVDPSNGVAIVDGAINGPATGANAAAYTNSFNGATTTTLFDISSATDTLYTQNPPNNGTLVVVGPLGVDAAAVSGFDILSADSTALAALTVGGATNLYRVSLTSGAATSLGTIGNGATSLSGIAVEI
ncbi:MAG: DUF4394 domain-containing protein, partial [Acidobacteriota bacterium]